jgi:hypothetical protein
MVSCPFSTCLHGYVDRCSLRMRQLTTAAGAMRAAPETGPVTNNWEVRDNLALECSTSAGEDIDSEFALESVAGNNHRLGGSARTIGWTCTSSKVCDVKFCGWQLARSRSDHLEAENGLYSCKCKYFVFF